MLVGMGGVGMIDCMAEVRKKGTEVVDMLGLVGRKDVDGERCVGWVVEAEIFADHFCIFAGIGRPSGWACGSSCK